MSAPEIIQTLVKRFSDNIKFYKSNRYNEAQLRQEFLDPFFEALGWDVYNKKNFAPLYREVDVERSISFQSTHTSKTPDYTFRLGEDPKFFVEAKRPSENLQTSSDFAFQLKAYAWNKHLPLSILTDFEEFLVFNCRRNPQKTDRPDIDCVMKLAYTDYIEKWDELISIFSPDSIRKGAFDKYAEDNISKKGVTEVDDLFLADISNWRELLARNIALRNMDSIDETGLNYAIQMTIDRIIFLRICEDRGIEPFNQLREITEKPGIYQNLNDLFKRAELKYNSGLFSFKDHKHATAHQDNFTPSLAIDDKVLKEIITHLYYPKRNYNFKAIPVEILGQVYEQFLGKVIRLTPGHMAKIDEKPEVRKAGGVYYTPKYIVDYIVANTVGKLLDGKTPDDASRLRIVDPACGSGSFLLGAFQYLINWHEDWYLNHDPEKWSRGKEPTLAPVDGGGYRISTPEKKRILINNIYGVDIDTQAVEVTKLSLLLKVLEEESGQLSLGFEHALPDLGNNIKCGNSLIGSDYFEGQLVWDEKERERVNPFDWHTAFPDVFRQGGFDAVIGNPPYSAKQSLETKKLKYIFPHVEYKCDPFAFFVEQGYRLIRHLGYLGFIIPVTWMTNFYYMKLRKHLIDTNSLRSIVLIDGLVFENANIDTCLLFLQKEGGINGKFLWKKTNPNNLNIESQERCYDDVKKNERYDIVPNFDSGWEELITKINKTSLRLDSFGKISLGMKLRSNDEFVSFTRDKTHPDGIFFGSDFSRYGPCVPRRFFNFEKAVIIGGTKKPEVHRARPKIIIQAIRNLSLKRRIVSTVDTNGDCFVGTVNGFVPNSTIYDIRYILGVLNSTFINEFFRRRFTTISLTSSFLGVIPLRIIDFSIPAEVKMHDRMVSLVEHMLELHKRTAQTPHEKERLEREIASTDAQIDHLVYDLYALTEDEIKIVEGG